MENKKRAPQDFNVGRAVSRLERSAFTFFSRRLKPFDIGPGQQAYLLSLAPGETLPQETLARRVGVDKANVSRALARLEMRGLVERVPAEIDGRQKPTRLSEEGIRIRQEIEGIAQEWIAMLREGVSPEEWETFAYLIEKIAAKAAE